MLDAKIKIDKNMFSDLEKELKYVKGAKAGYLTDEVYPETDIKISDVAIYNEFGTDKIPPRPFLRKSFKDFDKWAKHVDQWASKEIPLEEIAKRLGDLMRTSIIDSIDSNIPPPNAESTVKAKGSSHTLIDTGLMRNSVTSEVIYDSKS